MSYIPLRIICFAPVEYTRRSSSHAHTTDAAWLTIPEPRGVRLTTLCLLPRHTIIQTAGYTLKFCQVHSSIDEKQNKAKSETESCHKKFRIAWWIVLGSDNNPNICQHRSQTSRHREGGRSQCCWCPRERIVVPRRTCTEEQWGI